MRMRKIGLLALALVLALGALGVGYAHWTDTVFIEGQVCTGEVDVGLDPDRISEIDDCPDQNWDGWFYDGFTISCPNGYHFTGIGDAPEGKCPATVVFNTTDENGDGCVDILEVTIQNAYPHLLVHLSIYVCNCGTIPVILQTPIITQSDFLLIEYGDNIGVQLHPGECKEISLYVGVVQNRGYFADPTDPSTWTVDDESQDLLPMNSCDEGVEDITFTIEIPAEQWADCSPPPAAA
jgi:hypothetical protein